MKLLRCKRSYVRGSVTWATMSTFALLLGAVDAYGQTLRVQVRVAPELDNGPFSGRLIVLLSTQSDPKEELEPGTGESMRSVWIAAEEVQNLRPGHAFEFNPDRLAYPAPLSQAPPGSYQAMAVLDVNHHYAYNGLHPGDLRSPVMRITSLNPKETAPLTITLDQRVPELKLNPSPGTELFDFVSPMLSRFWGRPIHMRGVVVLPPSYRRKGARQFATAYVMAGFASDLNLLAHMAPEVSGKGMAEGMFPEMIHVVLDLSCAGGAHDFADSVNNGPWGSALTAELIPYLEGKYRMLSRLAGRLLFGHSSGGWAALWLLVNYPDKFGGAWPTAPDPADFRNFYGINLRSQPQENFYRKPDGTRRMWMRLGSREVAPIEELAQQERVLGEYGGVLSSFEWVFSPRGDDGRPQTLFDRETGTVNPEAVRAWQKYEIAEVIRRNADRLRPLLDGKIHVAVGTADTYRAEQAAGLLEQTLKDVRIRASFTYVEGRDHFNLFEDVPGRPESVRSGLLKTIFSQMGAVASGGN